MVHGRSCAGENPCVAGTGAVPVCMPATPADSSPFALVRITLPTWDVHAVLAWFAASHSATKPVNGELP